MLQKLFVFYFSQCVQFTASTIYFKELIPIIRPFAIEVLRFGWVRKFAQGYTYLHDSDPHISNIFYPFSNEGNMFLDTKYSFV